MNRRTRTTRHALTVSLLAAALAMPSARADTPPGLREIVTGFSAKEACSCALVVRQTDAYCQEFGKTGGFDVEVRIDRKAMTVTSSFAGGSRTARMVEGEGCKLDALE